MYSSALLGLAEKRRCLALVAVLTTLDGSNTARSATTSSFVPSQDAFIELLPDFTTCAVQGRTHSPLKMTRSDDAPLLQDILCLRDLDEAAETKLSRQAFAYYRSAADSEAGYHNNSDNWHQIKFRPRVLRGAGEFAAEATILGHRVQSPVMIAPCAMAGLATPKAELALCRAAGKAGIIYCVRCPLARKSLVAHYSRR